MFMGYQAPFRATGMGSMMTLHPRAGLVRTPEDAEKADKRIKQLLFLDLIEQGIYMAERGFMALSLMVSDDDCDRLVAAVETFIKSRRGLLAETPQAL
jgi:glutamate-1-semialdehyde 2,1-aminomutase